jgi:spermidine/putrescine-binding protein
MSDKIGPKGLVARLKAGEIGRRDFNKALAGVGLAMVAVPMAARRAGAEGEALYFGWAGYDDPAFHKSYVEKYGGLPNFTFWGSEDEAFQKMRMGGFTPDVMAPCTYELVKWHDAGLLKPLDPARLLHLKDAFSSLDNIEGSVINGQRYFMPMDWGNSTVIYRTDLVDQKYNEENSWQIMYDERYANRLAFYDSAGAVVEIAALIMGYDNIFSLTDEQLDKVRETVVKQRNLLRFYWSDNTEIDQALASGEIVAAYGWNDSYVRLKKEGLPVGMMVPKEGIFTWCCGLVMNSKVGNEEAAYDIINAMTSPEAGAYEIENWGYGHANTKAFDLVPPEKLKELGLSTPEALINNGIFFQALDPAIEEKYIRLFEEVKAEA